jgi:IS5 family transposase
VERQFDQLPDSIKPKAQEFLASVARILTQQPKDKNKLYALHAPEAECISKGPDYL